MIVGEQNIFGRKVVLRKEPVRGDLLCITTYDEALYWINGGFPTPDMYLLDKIKCLITPEMTNVPHDVCEKLRLGWCFLSYEPESHYILCKPDSEEEYLCAEEDVEDYIAKKDLAQHKTSGLSFIGRVKSKIPRI